MVITEAVFMFGSLYKMGLGLFNYLCDTGLIVFLVLMIPFALYDLWKTLFPVYPDELTHEENRWARGCIMQMYIDGVIPHQGYVPFRYENKIAVRNIDNPNEIIYLE